jgi:hypothetical protein
MGVIRGLAGEKFSVSPKTYGIIKHTKIRVAIIKATP